MNNKKNRGMMIDNSIVDEVKEDACSETEYVVEKAVRSEEVFEEHKEHEIIDAIVKCIRLNVREEPNLNSKKIGELVTGDEITIDFTGGTKPMTAGLVLASTGDKYTDSYNYSYVGSKMSENAEVRNKDGVGIVISGHEQIKPQKDPYDTYAVLEFNRGKNH